MKNKNVYEITELGEGWKKEVKHMLTQIFIEIDLCR